VAPNAVIIGDVTVGEGSSIWYGAVLRGDLGRITIGRNTSIQDNAVIHTVDNAVAKIGDRVTIAHGAVIHTATVKDGSTVGMNCVLLDNCVIGEKLMIAVGSVVAAGASIPSGILAAGSPAVPKKEISGEALKWVTKSAENYSVLCKLYLEQGLDKQ